MILTFVMGGANAAASFCNLSASSRQNNVSIEIFPDIFFTLHDRIVADFMDTNGWNKVSGQQNFSSSIGIIPRL